MTTLVTRWSGRSAWIAVLAMLAILDGMAWSGGLWSVVNDREGAAQLAVATAPLPLLPPHAHPANASPLEHGTWTSGTVVVPEDLWVKSFSVALAGTPVPNSDPMRNPVHQISVEKVGNADAWCPELDALLFLSGNTIFSQWAGTVSLWSDYAEFVPKGTVLRLNVLWHNNGRTTFSDLGATVTMEGRRPGKATERFVNVERYAITPAGCSGRTVGHVTVPPRVRGYSLSTSAAPLVFPRAGSIILISAHFHPEQGGRKLAVFLNDEPVFEFVPKSFTSKERDRLVIPTEGVPVKKGDRLTMSVSYDNASSAPNAGAMAIAAVFFAEDAHGSR